MFKNKMILGLIFVVGLGLGLGSAWATVSKKPTQEAKVKSKITGQKGTQIGEVKKVKGKILSPVKQAQAKTPTLLWKKEFATAISGVTMSGDGKYIAVTTKAESIDPTGGKPFKGSKLCFFDRSGKLLWQYTKGDNWELAGVEMSDDGNYIAVVLAKKVVVDSGIIEGEYHETVEFHVERLLFFDRSGNLLWEREATGYPIMSKGGEYILVSSDYYGNYHKFFDKKGDLLWQKPNTLKNMWFFTGDLSIDGNYIILGNTLYNKNGKVLHKYNVEEDVCSLISRYGNYIVFCTGEKILFYDKNGSLLWTTDSGSIFALSPNEKYLIIFDRGKIFFYNNLGQLLWSKETGYPIEGNSIFTHDSKFFAIGFCRRVYFYNINGSIIWQITLPAPISNGGWTIITMSANGEYMTVIYRDKSLYFYDNSKTVK